MPFEGGMPGYGKGSPAPFNSAPFQPMPFEGGMPSQPKGSYGMNVPNMGTPNMDPLLQAMMKRTRMRPY